MDRPTLLKLIQDHQAQVYRFLRYMGADEHLAEDLTQETFLAICRAKLGKLGGVERAGPYLCGVARNLLMLHWRRSRNQPAGLDGPALEQAQALWQKRFADRDSGLDYIDALQQCVSKLPPRQMQLVELQYRAGKSRRELASLFAMTEDGIKTAMRRIRAALAQCIRGRLGEPAGSPPANERPQAT